MNEVSADEELRASVGQCAYGVSIPDFLKEAFTHGWKSRRGWRRAGKMASRPGIVKAASGASRESTIGHPSAHLDPERGGDTSQRENSDDCGHDFRPIVGAFPFG